MTYTNPDTFTPYQSSTQTLTAGFPKAHVLWDVRGTQEHQLLTGPNDRFKIIDHAEMYAVEMAKVWIDAELVDNLTP